MLTPGARLGPYEVVGSLGKGGMGEVHRAKDTRLGREVALKVLPDDVASDPGRMARFEREARLLAALNHPHIAAIYGLEDAGASRALVMEVAEGSTLLARLAQGPIPVDEALPIARQMAGALEYAHEKGIVHRDLKPANVKVTPDGEVKLLDFGLAKAFGGDAEEQESNYSESPTLSHQATRAGVILGTASYMSPEQARGKTVDRRADIWSFGVVLLEMLTGRPTFSGESATDVLAAVVTSEPDLDRLPTETPSTVRRLLKRCLDRDPKRRLRDIGEARVLLESNGSGTLQPAPEQVVVSDRKSRRRTWLAAAFAVVALAAAAAFLAGQATAPNPLDDLRSSRLTFRRGAVSGARFAPDGQTIVYSASWDGEPLDLFSVRTDVRESRAMKVPGAGLLAVSSTGELAVSLGFRNTIGFESTGTLARMPLGTGAPREILENVNYADWAPNGQDLAVARDVEGRRRLEYPLGRVLHQTGGWLSDVRVSPDGRRVAFVDHPNRGDNQGRLSIADEEGDIQVLAERAANGVAWSPSSEEILYVQGSTLFAVNLSGRSRVVHRELAGLRLLDVSAAGGVLLSRTTSKREMVGRAPGASSEKSLSWLDWSFPALLSPDGRTVVFEEQNLVNEEGDYALFMRPTDGSPPVRLGDGRAVDFAPDGGILTILGMGSTNDLLVLPTGVGEARSLGPLGLSPTAGVFGPDGETIVAAGHAPGEGARVYVKELTGGAPRAISPEGVTAYQCDLLSPDGKEAFAIAPDGRLTLYPVDEGDPRVVPGTSLDDIPIQWTRDGRGILVQSKTALPARVERVDIATGERELLVELTPPDPAGVLVIGPVYLAPDAQAYVYSYKRLLDELYILEGLQ